MIAVGQSLSMEWQQTKSVNGVAATKVCQWSGSNQSLSMEWQKPKSVNGVAATKVCWKWQHVISLSRMAAYEMT